MSRLRVTPDLIIQHAPLWQPGVGWLAGDSVAVAGERIVAVGTAAEMADAGDSATRVIDARGRVLMPAFTDSHTHFARASIATKFFIDLEEIGAAAITDVVNAIGARVQQLPSGTWVQVDNLVPQRLAEGRAPHRRELDAVSPDHPVVMRGIGRHLVVANSLALSLAGITSDTPNPPGGRIGRDSDGGLTGSLHERGKLRLDMTAKDTVIPAVDTEQRLVAIKEGIARLHSVGITALHEMVREPVELGDYSRLRERGELGMRVRFYIRSVESQTQLEHLLRLGIRTGFGDEWLRIGGVKLSIDGWEVLGTAALYEPYPDDPANCGIIRIEQDVLEEEMRLAHANGLQIAVHAAGQRAVDLALQAYAKLLPDAGGNALRHRIEHVCLPPRHGQLERIRDFGLLLSTQPSFIEATGDLWRGMYADRGLETAVPLRSALDLGIRVQANSDFPCSRMDPWIGIRSAVVRRTRAATQLGTREAVTLPEAIEMYTTAAAYSAFDERVGGVIGPGGRADLIVLDDDPFALPAEELNTVRVGLTVAGGAVVFERQP